MKCKFCTVLGRDPQSADRPRELLRTSYGVTSYFVASQVAPPSHVQ